MNSSTKKLFLAFLFVCLAQACFAQQSPPRGDMMDNIIALAMILFILSLITERVSNFFKLRLSDSKRKSKRGSLGRFLGFNNTAIRAKNPQEEKKREFRVLKINLFFGILTALIFRADLLQIIDHINEPASHIGWDSFLKDWPQNESWGNAKQSWYRVGSILATFLGCCLTGGFLSFGSKFWHDLIDLLLEIKNARRLLSGSKQDLLDHFSNLSSDEQLSTMRSAIAVNRQNWYNNISNIQGFGIAQKIHEKDNGASTGQLAIQFFVSKKEDNPDAIPNPVPPFIQHGNFRIPTDVIVQKPAKPYWNYKGNEDGFRRKPGGTISTGRLKCTGTLGIKVVRNVNNVEKTFLLSCFHVLYHQRLNAQKNTLLTAKSLEESDLKIEVRSPGVDTHESQFKTLGKTFKGKLNPIVDAAIAELENDKQMDTDIKGLGYPEDIYTPIKEDVGHLLLEMSGAKSGVRKKILLHAVDDEIPIDYFDDEDNMFQMTGLLRLSKCAQPGDSGAPVLDSKRRIVGMIVGGNDDFSFAIPIQTIINQLQIFPIIKKPLL